MILTIKRQLSLMLRRFTFFDKKVLPFYAFLKLEWKIKKVIVPNLSTQLVFKNGSYPNQDVKGKGILIPWIETNHYTLYTMLIIAKALDLRGAKVIILVCDQYLGACENKNVRNEGVNVCSACKLTQDRIIPLFNLNTIRLSELIDSELLEELKKKAEEVCRNYPDSFEYHGIDLIHSVNESIIRYYYGADPPSETEKIRLRFEHLLTAMICTEASRIINEKFHSDILLSQTWVYSMGRPFFRFFENVQNCRTCSFCVAGHNYSAFVIDDYKTFINNERFNKFIKIRNRKMLTEEERAELRGWFNERLNGTSTFHAMHGGFKRNVDLKKLLKIDKSKRNLFMFTGLFWDAKTDEEGTIFDSLPEWLVSTVDILKDKQDINLYIKVHLAEAFGTKSLKGVLDFVYEKYPVLPKNIIPILPEWQINPYDLFPYMDAALIYNSTTGLEAAYMDIPVILAGKSQYSGVDLVWEPKTQEEYISFLCDKNLKIKHDKEFFELFCYYYFIKRPVPFNLTDRVLSNNNFEKYKLHSLDDIMPGENYMLDHLCDCLLNGKLPESW